MFRLSAEKFRIFVDVMFSFPHVLQCIRFPHVRTSKEIKLITKSGTNCQAVRHQPRGNCCRKSYCYHSGQRAS
jgi:hypothetical protein